MSYALVIADVRRGVFDDRNLDAIGICNIMQKDIILLIPDGNYILNEKLVNTILKVKAEETIFLNPLNITDIIDRIIKAKGSPDIIVFTYCSSGTELAAYASGYFNLPVISDVSGYDKEKGIFLKSYYSDKIFGEFRPKSPGPFIITVRSGSFKEFALEKPALPSVETIEDISENDGRIFVEYIEEEKTGIDITKAEFLLSIGRGIGSKDEIPAYEELVSLLKAVLSGSRPVVDKMWLPSPRQVGTSGKTVKPKVYLAMGISGAFQHIAGMKDSGCIIAVNKDPQAPIFQYAHYGVIADANKLRDKLKEIIKGLGGRVQKNQDIKNER